MDRKKASAATKSKRAQHTGNFKMIADRFDDRTFANMEVALERSLGHLGKGREDHDARRQIAQKLVKCAGDGDTTLAGLTEAGREAATKLANSRAS